MRKKLKQLIKGGHYELAVGFALLTVIYIGKYAYPPTRVSQYKVDGTAFELWAQAEARKRRIVEYLNVMIPGYAALYEMLKSLLISSIEFLPYANHAILHRTCSQDRPILRLMHTHIQSTTTMKSKNGLNKHIMHSIVYMIG